MDSDDSKTGQLKLDLPKGLQFYHGLAYGARQLEKTNYRSALISKSVQEHLDPMN